MTNSKFAVRTAAATFFISTLAASGAAFSQDADDDSGALEEIVVTAQKREKTLLDTPIAVSAFSGETLSQSGVRDIRDLQVLAPSYNVTSSQSAFQTVVSIRGIGSSGQNPGIEPSVGIYVDGVFRSRTGAALGDFLSVERVEILRGPQSTLFGKNTSAGVISIITKKPEYEAGGSVELTYGNYNQIVAKGTVTGPLVEDKVAVRLSANYNKRDGFLTNLVDGSDVNDRDRYSLRGQLLFEPSETVSIRLIADYAKSDERCCAAPFFFNGPTMGAIALLGGTITGTLGGSGDPFAREIAFDSEVRAKDRDFGFSAEVNVDLGAATFTSITAYRDYQTDTELDADFTSLSVIARNGDFTKVETFTQEFRITSNGDNKVDWLVGGYYFNQKLSADGKVTYGADARNFFDLLSGFNADPIVEVAPGVWWTLSQAFGIPDALVNFVFPGGFESRLDIIELALDPATFSALGASFADGSGMTREIFNNDAESYALFGQFDVHFSDQLTLTAGLRYTNEDKNGKAVFTNSDFFAAIPLAAYFGDMVAGAFGAMQILPPVADFDRNRKESKLTGNVILAYEVNDDVSTYASYSRGYKAGGFDISRAAKPTNPDFEPETVDNMELGLKARVMDGRGRINLALYSQKVKNFQTVLFIGTGFEVRNAGDIKLKGIELDAEFAPTDNFNFTLAAAYSDAKYGSFFPAPCPVNNPIPGGCDLSGEPLVDAPKLTFTGTATLTQPISDTLTAFLRGEIYSRGGRFTDSDNDPNNWQGSSFLANASFGIQTEAGWELIFWGKNLTKDNYGQVIFDSVGQPGSFSGYPNDPRTYGVTVRGAF
jgi:outer membrane receptor protein involved in Fe transport